MAFSTNARPSSAKEWLSSMQTSRLSSAFHRVIGRVPFVTRDKKEPSAQVDLSDVKHSLLFTGCWMQMLWWCDVRLLFTSQGVICFLKYHKNKKTINTQAATVSLAGIIGIFSSSIYYLHLDHKRRRNAFSFLWIFPRNGNLMEIFQQGRNLCLLIWLF